MEKTDYGRRFEMLMQDRKINAKEMARRIGVTPVAVTKMFKGGMFGVDALFSAARLFNVSAYWLHTGEGPRGTWPQFASAQPAAELVEQAARPLSLSAMTLGMLYDTSPQDENMRAVIFRRATAALLGHAQPEGTPQSGALSPPGSPKKLDV